MVNSIGSFGPAMNMRALARSSSTSETGTTGETKKSPSEDLFSKLDADASGGLSTSELQSFVDKMSNDTRSALLSTQEASTSSTSTSATSSTTADDLLTAMDEDADGSVSESELDTWMQANRPAGPPPPPPSEEAGATDDTDPASALFGAIDGDGDGSVSETELSDFLSSLATDETTSTDGSSTASTSETDEASTTFDAIDTDGDGAITQAELDAYMKAQMASAPPPPPPGGFGEESGSDTVSEVASTSSTSSTSSSTSSTSTDDLAARLSAAMARFATEAYGRVDTSSTVSTLLASVA